MYIKEPKEHIQSCLSIKSIINGIECFYPSIAKESTKIITILLANVIKFCT